MSTFNIYKIIISSGILLLLLGSTLLYVMYKARGESSSGKPKIMIYNGEGAGAQSLDMLENALVNAVSNTSYDVSFITPEQIIEGSWIPNTALIAFPGGYDLGFVRQLGNIGSEKIRTYVEQGGSYIGFCAGGYFACDYIEFDKGGPQEVIGDRPLKFFPGKCIGPVFEGFDYNSNKGVHPAYIEYNTTEGQRFAYHVYFNGGFRLEELSLIFDRGIGIDRKYSIVGKYLEFDDLPPSTAKLHVGLGKAVITGVHFEFNPFLLPQGDPYLEPILPLLKSGNSMRLKTLHDALTFLGITLKDDIKI